MGSAPPQSPSPLAANQKVKLCLCKFLRQRLKSIPIIPFLQYAYHSILQYACLLVSLLTATETNYQIYWRYACTCSRLEPVGEGPVDCWPRRGLREHVVCGGGSRGWAGSSATWRAVRWHTDTHCYWPVVTMLSVLKKEQFRLHFDSTNWTNYWMLCMTFG